MRLTNESPLPLRLSILVSFFCWSTVYRITLMNIVEQCFIYEK